MEELARTLRRKINDICVEYHYFKKSDTIQKSKVLAGEIQEYVSYFIQGNIFGMDEEEYKDLYSFSLGILEDYIASIENEDAVRMIDTLDYGLRELLSVFGKEESEDEK